MKKIIVFIVSAFILSNCQKNKDEYLIEEGLGVSVFKLGVKVSESPKEIDGVTLMVNRDSLIYAIDIISNEYYTKDRIRVGTDYKTIIKQRGMYDTTKIIEKANPTNREKDKFPQSMRYDDITYFLNNKGIVYKIRIY